MRDLKTEAYFDKYTPRYSSGRLDFALSFINDTARDGARLVDVGCGDGSVMKLVSESTGVRDFTGVDVSQAYLAKAADAVGCRTVNGSMLDDTLAENMKESFDYCLAVSILHHMIGDSRAHSRELAARCLKNCFSLLKPGGHLIVFEPAFEPPIMMDIVFSIKKFFSRFGEGRVEIFRSWANIGNPVVSYYSPDVLNSIARGLGGEVVLFAPINRSRLGFVLRRTAVGMIIRKPLE